MAYPMHYGPIIDTRPQRAQGSPYATSQEATEMLHGNMMAGEPTYGGLGPHGAMASVGGFNPLQLALLGGAIALPAGIAAWKWMTGGSEPDQPYQPPPAEPEYDWKNDPEGLFQLNPFIPDDYKGQQ